MNSFKNLFFIIFLLSVTISFAADHDQQKLKDQVNEIVQEIQSGFTMHDRLLRPSMVGVSKKTEDGKKKQQK